FKGILVQNGLQEMKSAGEKFDPEIHDAVTNVPAPTEDKKGKVIDEVEKGYYLNGKVIRHAKVIVGN
ncbi:MAG TPA: nucleotide exchange factor GrpE, partial [Bacteroidia bacterium]|nr:nucleotide exchange factor GrpE [Bacteroidia bacterium]